VHLGNLEQGMIAIFGWRLDMLENMVRLLYNPPP